MNNSSEKKSDNSLLLKYAGFATQFLIAIGLGVFIGLKTDKWLHVKTPVTTWVFPLLIITILIYKVIKDTSLPKKDK